jgi:ATP-dependent helicase/nuclease subunit B
MRLDDGEFLPFSAAWAQVREGYLVWLAKHETAEGAVFLEAEGEHERELGRLRLVGRIDRIDRVRGGVRMVMDYKTESADTSKERVKHPVEDTQLAFYAALLGDTELRAAYVNVGERGETRTVEQPHVIEAREMLLAGIAHDLARIAQGVPLPALGEGKACEYCAARGLCRKDFWA